MPGSSEEKILNETAKSKASTGEELGFRIAGLQQKDSMGKITKKLSRSEAFKTIKKEVIYSLIIRLKIILGFGININLAFKIK